MNTALPGVFVDRNNFFVDIFLTIEVLLLGQHILNKLVERTFFHYCYTELLTIINQVHVLWKYFCIPVKSR